MSEQAEQQSEPVLLVLALGALGLGLWWVLTGPVGPGIVWLALCPWFVATWWARRSPRPTPWWARRMSLADLRRRRRRSGPP